MKGRRDWVQADLRCMLCGRTLGRLVGPAPAPAVAEARGLYTIARADQFSAFRPADPSEPTRRLNGREQFQCVSCGGRAIVDDVETFSTYDDAIEDEEPERRPRGRPPKPWRRLPDTRLVELGLAG